MFRTWTLAAGLLIAASLTAAAQTPAEFLAQGNHAAARASLHRMVGGSPDAALHFAFLEAMILQQQGQTEKAVRLFRDILAAEPGFEPARRELALTLARGGQMQGALFHAERLVATTPDARLRADLQAFITANRAGRPRGVTTRFAIEPSSNANRGTEAQSVTLGGLDFLIDEPSRAKRAVALAVGATAWNRWTLSDRWDLTLSGSADARIFDSAVIEDDLIALVRLDFGRNGPRGRLTFGPLAEQRWRGGDVYRTRLGFGISGVLQPRADRQVYGVVTLWDQRHPGRDYLDGTLASGSFGMTQFLSPSLKLAVSLPVLRERTGRAHLDHDDIGLSVGFEKQWPGGLITGLSASHTTARYKGDYPALGTPRHDDISGARLTVRSAKLSVGNFTPEVSYSYTRSRSNVAFHDYESHDFGLSLTQRF